MKTRHGQHFLIDQQVLDRIIHYAELTSSDTVLEIGGGTGNLTQKISAASGRVITIELDHDLGERLKELAKNTNITVIIGDALKVTLPYFNKVVSNLPYQISSQITFRLLRHPFDVFILMYQLEFARRMLASPGTADYSRLSVTSQYHAHIELLETIPPSAFKPQPKVYSTVLKLTPRKPSYKVNDMEFFEKFLKVVFGQRRKKLKNSLRMAAPLLGIPVENILTLI